MYPVLKVFHRNWILTYSAVFIEPCMQFFLSKGLIAYTIK
jgi:hypothetical protein